MSLDKALDMMYDFFEKEAKAKGKVKARNRPNPVFQSTHPKVTDNKDHFPLKDEDQARNALSQVAKYKSAPKWWSGSLSEVQNAVRRRVKSKYPSIEVTEGKKKSKKAEEAILDIYKQAVEDYKKKKR